MIRLNINTDRPIEELTGENRAMVRWKLGNIHCMTSFRDALKECRPEGVRKAPPALRRGLIKCVADTLNEYRGVYSQVTRGTL